MSSVRTIWVTPDAENIISYCARVSSPQNQENYETSAKLLKYCLNQKHFSIFEMANMCVEINTTRAISAQLLRHKSFSFQEYCLAGNAKITISTKNGSVQRLPIKQLHENWGSMRFKARYARSYDPGVGRFIEAPILSVYESGEKPVYRFTIKAANTTKTIDCTNEHRVLTKEKGFVCFEEAYNQGLTIALNGETAEPLPYQDPAVLQEHAWMGSTQFAKEFNIAEVTARKWFCRHKIEPYNPNNAPRSDVNATWETRKSSFMKWARKNVRKNSCEFCGHNGSESRLELSHISAHDGDPSLCFNEENLQTLCAKCHRRHDIDVQKKRYGWTLSMTAKWGKIISRQSLGIQMTYDIEMDHPTHNFVANGIVVHNSQRYSDTTAIGQPVMPHLRRQDQKNRQNSIDDLNPEIVSNYYRRISTLFEDAEHLYKEMVSSGIAKECARSVLPLAAPTRLYMNGTLRSWITYLALREKNGTQLEHMAIAKDIKVLFCGQFPMISEALGGEGDWEI
jgi:thymidylate synthase ThyX